jgi:F-type H+-transporting ATPase subunit delta
MSSSYLNVAKAYARSAVELGLESKVDIAAELTIVQELINGSNDLENVLFLEVFTLEEKKNVLEALFEKIKLSLYARNFLFFLIAEMRMNLFPQIYKEIMVIDDHHKGLMRVEILGVEDSLSEEAQKLVSAYLREKLQMEPKIQYRKEKDLIAGHRVKAEDLLLDTSLDNQFEMFKKSIFGD